MSREWTFRVGNSTVMPEKNHPFPREWMDHNKLYAAIDIAREMVSAAREQLGILCSDLDPQAADWSGNPFKWKQTGGTGMVHSWLKDERKKDTARALAKYFSLEPKDPSYVGCIDMIVEAYDKIAAGLASNLEIVVFNPVARKDWQDINKPVTARGFVPMQKPDNKEHYKNFLELKREMASMGLVPDPYWGKLGKGRIHISLSLFISGGHENGPDAIARTLVHEASHKFADTKDHLYKHQSFVGNEFMDASDVDFANREIGVRPSSLAKRGVAYEHGKPVERGKVLPMVGKVNGTKVTETMKFIENADSYAWAARRIWKRYR